MTIFQISTTLRKENGYSFMLAFPEKAICDLLYNRSPCGNRMELRQLLFDDLRIDENAFRSTNRDDMTELAGLYHTTN